MREFLLMVTALTACSGDAPGDKKGVHTNVVSNNELCNIRDYGAVGDGAHDDSAAINMAVAACHGHIYIPTSASCYLYSGTIDVSGAQFSASALNAGFMIAGDGPIASCIANTASASPTIVAASAEAGTLVGVRLIHTAPAPGGDGIRFSGPYSNYAVVKDVDVSQNDIGLNLTDTNWGTIWQVTANHNLTHGIAMTSVGVTQWQLFDVTASENGGDGLYVTGTGAMGEINGFTANANGNDGLEIATTGVIGDLRLKSSSLIGNVGWGLHLDAGPGSTADIVSTHFDANGAGGVYASAVVDNVSISDSSISSNQGHGAVIYAESWQVLGGNISGNTGSGFYAGAGRGRIGQVTATSNANYGVFIDAGVAYAAVAGVQASANGLGAIYSTDPTNTVLSQGMPSMTPYVTPPPILGLPALPLTGLCDIRTYGAVGDGVTDDTAAILAASAACAGRVYVPASGACYLFSSTLSFSGGSFAVVGDQQMQSCIESTAPALPIIAATDTSGGVIANLHLTHTAPVSGVRPTISQVAPGGDGVRVSGSTNDLTIANVYVEDNDVGLNLDRVTHGILTDVITLDNTGHGIAMAGTGWQMADVFTAGNGGDGLYVAGNGSLEPANTVQAWYNVGHGIELIGAGGPLSATFANCYVGADLQSGFYLDSNGGTLNITSCQLEGGAAGGLYATPSNAAVNLFSIAANNNTGNAIELHSQRWQVSGGNLLLNQGNGIYAAEGSGAIFGVRMFDNTGYGLTVASTVTAAEIAAVDDEGNGAPLSCGPNCVIY